MDVCKKVLLLFLSIFIVQCDNKKDEPLTSQFVKSNAPSCEDQVINGEYFVVWKDGHTSVEKFSSEEEYIENFLKKNIDQIKVSEPHYQVLVEKNLNHNSVEKAYVNWGVDAIEATSAWDQSVTGNNIIVAVIDSGLDTNHPELVPALAINKNEVADNGIDDDDNGYVDDIHGYDFVSNTGEVTDYTGHGTHVAGVIAAQHSIGEILGVAPEARILPLNFINATGGGSISGAVSAIRYAADFGAKIINASWGGNSCSPILKSEIEALADKNILFVTAAGNSGSNISVLPEYPAAFELNNLITVGSSSIGAFTSGFSNYGLPVDLVAPGDQIISTFPKDFDIEDDLGTPNDGLKELDGTSMATPHVAAAAALIWATRPGASYVEVKNAILKGVQAGPYPVSTRGQLNVRRSLEIFSE